MSNNKTEAITEATALSYSDDRKKCFSVPARLPPRQGEVELTVVTPMVASSAKTMELRPDCSIRLLSRAGIRESAFKGSCFLGLLHSGFGESSLEPWADSQ